MKQRRNLEDRARAIRAALAKGDTAEEIAEDLNLSVRHIYRLMDRLGLGVSRGDKPDEPEPKPARHALPSRHYHSSFEPT